MTFEEWYEQNKGRIQMSGDWEIAKMAWDAGRKALLSEQKEKDFINRSGIIPKDRLK